MTLKGKDIFFVIWQVCCIQSCKFVNVFLFYNRRWIKTMSPCERYPKPKTEVIYAPSVPPGRSSISISPQRKLLWPLWVGGALPYPEVARSPGRPKMAPMTLREGSIPCKAPAVDSWRETQRVMALGKCSLIPSTKVPYMLKKAVCLSILFLIVM